MSRWTTKTIALALIVLLLPAFADAKRNKNAFEWDEITEADWNLSVDSTRGIRDAAMVFERIMEDDEKMKNEKCYRTIYRRIRILSDEGRKWADGETPSVGKDAKVVMLQGRTVLRDGTEITLEEEQVFEKEVVKIKYRKYRQYSFSIPGATDDCIVEYVFKIKSPRPIVEWTIQKEIPLLQGELHWHLAQSDALTLYDILSGGFTNRAANYLWLNVQSEKDVQQLPNIKKPEETVFTIGFVPAFHEEPNSVPQASIKAKLLTYYGANKTPAAFWGDMSNWLAKWLDQFCKENDRVKELVKQFDSLETEERKIAAAYQWVQDSIVNTTYVELDRHQGESEKKRKKRKEKQNESANDVMKRRYGDQVDIEYVFCDMLREMNIDARIAFAKDRFNDLFVQEAKYWQFDESLVAVRTDSGNVFYAPGHPFAPLGRVPWYLEGVQALISGGVELRVIPFSEAGSNTTSRSFAYTVTGNGPVEGHAEVTLSGHGARSVRMAVLDEEYSDYKDLLMEDITELFPEAEIDSLQWQHLDERDQPVRLSWHASCPELGAAGDRLLLQPFDYMSEMVNPFYSDERKHGILFDYAYKLQESAQFTLPEGMTVESLPQDSVYQNQVGSFSVAFTNFGNALVVGRFFTLNRAFWPSDAYPQVRDLFQTWENLRDMVVVLSRSSGDDNTARE